ASPQDVQKVLSRIGLPTALMTSRAEDKKLEALNRILCFRFPQVMYSGDTDKNPVQVYKKLTPDEQKKVDKDLSNVQDKVVGPYQIEQVLPTAAEEARAHGAVAIGSGISLGGLLRAGGIIKST